MKTICLVLLSLCISCAVSRWHPNAIRVEHKLTPLCDSIAHWSGNGMDESYYYIGDTLHWVNNISGEETDVILKDSL